jgi:sulfite exporter TauE/SafE
MTAAFAWTALLMGLAGGPHCLAMCAAPCSAVAGGGRPGRQALFHGGRLLGYALAGGLAAFAMESLAWVTQQAWSLRPLWTFTHVAVLAWGLMMMAQARQPAWVENAGRAVWRRVRPLVAAPGGTLAAGCLWALMPCGLLYSALLVAALSGGPVPGALSMLCFALGSGLWLVGGPWLWGRLRSRVNGWRASWGTRLAGLLLFGIAAWALWMDLVYKPSLWCR